MEVWLIWIKFVLSPGVGGLGKRGSVRGREKLPSTSWLFNVETNCAKTWPISPPSSFQYKLWKQFYINYINHLLPSLPLWSCALENDGNISIVNLIFPSFSSCLYHVHSEWRSWYLIYLQKLRTRMLKSKTVGMKIIIPFSIYSWVNYVKYISEGSLIDELSF